MPKYFALFILFVNMLYINLNNYLIIMNRSSSLYCRNLKKYVAYSYTQFFKANRLNAITFLATGNLLVVFNPMNFLPFFIVLLFPYFYLMYNLKQLLGLFVFSCLIMLINNPWLFILFFIIVIVISFGKQISFKQTIVKNSFKLLPSIITMAVPLLTILHSFLSNDSMSFEATILVVSLVLIFEVENAVTKNKVILTQHRARFLTSMCKSNSLSIYSISSVQFQALMRFALSITVSGIIYIITSGNYLVFLTIVFGCFYQLLYEFDLLTQHYFLTQSRLYADKISRGIFKLIPSLTISYFILGTLIVNELNRKSSSTMLLNYLSSSFLLWFICWCLFYCRRLYKTHNIKKTFFRLTATLLLTSLILFGCSKNQPTLTYTVTDSRPSYHGKVVHKYQQNIQINTDTEVLVKDNSFIEEGGLIAISINATARTEGIRVRFNIDEINNEIRRITSAEFDYPPDKEERLYALKKELRAEQFTLNQLVFEEEHRAKFAGFVVFDLDLILYSSENEVKLDLSEHELQSIDTNSTFVLTTLFGEALGESSVLSIVPFYTKEKATVCVRFNIDQGVTLLPNQSVIIRNKPPLFSIPQKFVYENEDRLFVRINQEFHSVSGYPSSNGFFYEITSGVKVGDILEEIVGTAP